MYAVAKEHRGTKLFVKSRRAVLPTKVDKFDNSIRKDAKDLQLKELCTISKPLLSGKQLRVKHTTEEISAQHEAMIRYINDSWKCIKQELEYSRKSANGDINNNTNSNNNSALTNGSNSSIVSKIKYINACNSSVPKNFVPFDLESFWGQRIYQNLLKSS